MLLLVFVILPLQSIPRKEDSGTPHFFSKIIPLWVKLKPHLEHPAQMMSELPNILISKKLNSSFMWTPPLNGNLAMKILEKTTTKMHHRSKSSKNLNQTTSESFCSQEILMLWCPMWKLRSI